LINGKYWSRHLLSILVPALLLQRWSLRTLRRPHIVGRLIHRIAYSLSKQLLLHSDWSAGESVSKDLSASAAEGTATAAGWVISWMLRHLNSSPLFSVRKIIAVITEHINVFGPKKGADLLISIFLTKVIAFLCWFVAQVNDVICSSSFVSISNLILILHLLYFLALS